jgi:HEAT repeat protein
MRRAATVLIALGLAVAVSAGCRKRPEERVADLVERLKSSDTQVSGAAAKELIDIGEPAVPSIAALLKDPDPRVRRAAATTLWGLGVRMPAAVPALAETLGDPDAEVRLAAAMALESAGPHAAPAVAALTNALQDADINVRLWSCKALGAVGSAARPAIPALVAASKVDFLRGPAEDALRKIQGAS